MNNNQPRNNFTKIQLLYVRKVQQPAGGLQRDTKTLVILQCYFLLQLCTNFSQNRKKEGAAKVSGELQK